MIQIDKDGVTVFYTDANGVRVSKNWMDGQAYSDMLAIRTKQMDAAATNAQAVTNYNNVLANAQLSVNLGKGDTVTAPPKPLMIVVADADGAVTDVPFVPPLADLVRTAAQASGIPTATPQGLAALSPSQPNQTDNMYNMILAMFRKAFPDA